MQKGGGGRRYGKEVGGEGEVGDISTSSLRPDEWSRKSRGIFRCLIPQTTTKTKMAFFSLEEMEKEGLLLVRNDSALLRTVYCSYSSERVPSLAAAAEEGHVMMRKKMRGSSRRFAKHFNSFCDNGIFA